MKRLIIFIMISVMISTQAFAYDLNTVSEKTAEELAVYMHPETKHLAEYVIRICAENEVSAEFISAVMRYERRPDIHNWFGWSENGLISFASDIECLESVIPQIKDKYLTENGIYYNGATISGVSVCYNNTDLWRETIIAEVERMLNNEKKTGK